MEKRSLIAYTGSKESEQKFDYFLTGLTGVLFAYIAQTYTPRKLNFSPDSLEPLSLVFLGLAFFYGLKRIESSVCVHRDNHSMLDHQEKAGEMTKAIGSSSSGFNPETGEMIHVSELPLRRDFHIRHAEAAEIRVRKSADAGANHYTKRNIFLYAGFAAIFLSKVLQPYAQLVEPVGR
jgi:hypothetical protein